MPVGFSVHLIKPTGVQVSYLINDKGEEIWLPRAEIPARLEWGPPGTMSEQQNVPVPHDVDEVLHKVEQALS